MTKIKEWSNARMNDISNWKPDADSWCIPIIINQIGYLTEQKAFGGTKKEIEKVKRITYAIHKIHSINKDKYKGNADVDVAIQEEYLILTYFINKKQVCQYVLVFDEQTKSFRNPIFYLDL
tara:strand:- start:820 stop:1182 length:363 start_codon:yes stop_codon:yes gene_type:complete